MAHKKNTGVRYRYGNVTDPARSLYAAQVRLLCALEPYGDYPEVQKHIRELRAEIRSVPSEEAA